MKNPPFSWCCPYCDQNATITTSNVTTSVQPYYGQTKLGSIALFSQIIVCPNMDCLESTITAELRYFNKNATDVFNAPKGMIEFDFIHNSSVYETWQIKPQSLSKTFPEYIPKAIRDDYKESCLIRDLSPKASAALSRRCLQGMIRDFWGIKKNTLYQEITELKNFINDDLWQAINAVRSIGNIGAHMEKDINLIIDVEPREAQLLTELIEMLIDEWYINRHNRELKLANLTELAKTKTQQRQKNS